MNYYADKLVKWLNEENNASLTEDDIKLSDYDNSTYETPYGEFLVLTDEQANVVHKERVENLVDELGITGLFKEPYLSYIIDNFVDASNLEDVMREDYESYCSDIETQKASNSFFENRLQEELFERTMDGYDVNDYEAYVYDVELFRDVDFDTVVETLKSEIMNTGHATIEDGKIKSDGVNYVYVIEWLNNPTIEDIDEIITEYFEETYSGIESDIDAMKDWFLNYEDNKDDLIDECVRDMIDDYDSPIDWVRDNFGDKEINEILSGNWNVDVEIDFDGLSEYLADTDGRGNELSPWDGNEHEFRDSEDGDYVYIYRQDNTIYEKELEEQKDV